MDSDDTLDMAGAKSSFMVLNLIGSDVCSLPNSSLTLMMRR